MNDHDFYQGLKDDATHEDEFAAGAEHFVRMKRQTGLDQHQFQEELEKVAGIDPLMIVGPAIGAGVTGVLTYLRSRPKDNGKSKDEEDAQELMRSTKPESKDGYVAKLRHNFSTTSRDLARTAKEHPVKAAITGAGAGGLAGHTIAKLLGAGGKY